MFYKFYQDGRRKVVDLLDLYEGQSCFLLGGSPSLLKEDLNALNISSALCAGINNSSLISKTQFNFSGDKPRCFDKKILYDASILKFANLSRINCEIDNIPWKYFSSTLFYPCDANIDLPDFFKTTRTIAWWKNTWFIAIQILYFLGFRTIYTVGADFIIRPDYQYAWSTKLTDVQIESNNKLYAQTVNKMRELKPYMELYGLTIKNCSPTSLLIDDFGYIPLSTAVSNATKTIYRPIDTSLLPHSLEEQE